MNRYVTRICSLLLLITLCGFADVAGAMVAQQPANSDPNQQNTENKVNQTGSQTAGATPQTGTGQNLPDSPSAAQSSSKSQPASQVGDEEPRGTAAAQAAKTHGGAASKPAGAAIAPAKQRRTRSLLIKLGVIAGAGAALGTVYGLSKGSPSRPPGAR